MASGGIEEFDWARNVARVGAGFKSNPYFNNPTPVPAMTIGGDWPAEVLAKFHDAAIPQPTPSDPWVVRDFDGKMGL